MRFKLGAPILPIIPQSRSRAHPHPHCEWTSAGRAVRLERERGSLRRDSTQAGQPAHPWGERLGARKEKQNLARARSRWKEVASWLQRLEAKHGEAAPAGLFRSGPQRAQPRRIRLDGRGERQNSCAMTSMPRPSRVATGDVQVAAQGMRRHQDAIKPHCLV